MSYEARRWRRAEVLATLARTGPATVDELLEQLGGPRAALREVLRRAEASQRVRVVGRRRRPAAGRPALLYEVLL